VSDRCESRKAQDALLSLLLEEILRRTTREGSDN
jgi:hypothetical protein